MTLLEVARAEFKRRNLIAPGQLLERFCASVCAHIFNLHNIDKPVVFENGVSENQRIHIAYITPSGFGKSTLFRTFLDQRNGMMAKGPFPTSVRSTFTPESWMGTLSETGDGEVKQRTGLFGRYKSGIIGADDFMRLKEMMDGLGITNEEVYLMSALEGDTITKDMAKGSIEESGIGTTLWSGLRPVPMRLYSGLARRFTFQLFFPGPKTARAFLDAISGDSRAGESKAFLAVVRDIEKTVKGGKAPNTNDVIDWARQQDVPHFEARLYRRLAVGMSLATGTFPKVSMSKAVESLLRDEMDARHVIRDDPRPNIVAAIAQESPGCTENQVKRFIVSHYQVAPLEANWMLQQAIIRKLVVLKGGNVNASS